jgi:hypothetical protein
MGARRGGVPRRIDRHRPIVVGLVGWGPTVSVRRCASSGRRGAGLEGAGFVASGVESFAVWCGSCQPCHPRRFHGVD